MRAVVQRVLSAQVEVGPVDAREVVADMREGLLVLIGVGHADSEKDAQELIRKNIGLRVFEDAQGKMNKSLADVDGTLGLVSQFTLWADVRKGRRPSFGDAADPGSSEATFRCGGDLRHEAGYACRHGTFRRAHESVTCEQWPNDTFD